MHRTSSDDDALTLYLDLPKAPISGPNQHRFLLNEPIFGPQVEAVRRTGANLASYLTDCVSELVANPAQFEAREGVS
jgi:hypothetical protein